MTPTDWFGLVVVVILTALMIYIYFWVFRPQNKSKIEAHRDFVLKEQFFDAEDKNGRV